MGLKPFTSLEFPPAFGTQQDVNCGHRLSETSLTTLAILAERPTEEAGGLLKERVIVVRLNRES